MKNNRSLEIFMTLMLFVIFGSVLAIVGYQLYGHATQSANITITVTGQEINTISDTVCATPNAAQIQASCTTTSSHYYKIFSKDETFESSDRLYYQFKTGRKYAVHVVGWPGSREITQILEEGK